MAWILLCILLVSLISAQSLHTTYAAIAKHPMEESSIQYPETLSEVKDHIPDTCKDLTYCTIKPKDYPEDKFNKMFKDYKVLPQPSMVEDLKSRQGDPDGTDDCDSEVTYEPLYKVKEKIDQPWRTVIQAPGPNFIQRVRLERCTNPGAPCFKSFSPSQEYTTFCKQKVNVWQVMVAKGDNDTEVITAELPVCCSCHYMQIDFKTIYGKPKQ